MNFDRGSLLSKQTKGVYFKPNVPYSCGLRLMKNPELLALKVRWRTTFQIISSDFIVGEKGVGLPDLVLLKMKRFQMCEVGCQKDVLEVLQVPLSINCFAEGVGQMKLFQSHKVGENAAMKPPSTHDQIIVVQK